MADLRTEGKFDRIKGRARAMWGELTDDDFDSAQGNTEDLIGRIKEKTGAAGGGYPAQIERAIRRRRRARHLGND